MRTSRWIFTLALLGLISTLWASPISARHSYPGSQIPQEIGTSGANNQIGNKEISVDARGKIRIRTATGDVILTPDSTAITKNGPTDLYIDPGLLNGPGTPVFGLPHPLSPIAPLADSGMLNRLSAYFSSASGGFGFRIAFDRQITPDLRLRMGPEFLTYSLARSAQILGDAMPDNTTRITLFSLPVGFQRHFGSQNRIAPFVGFGVGPMLRFDHRPQSGRYAYDNWGFNTAIGYQQSGLGFTVPLFVEDYPGMSLTLGGNVATGISFRFGKKKALGLTVEGRYTLARFVDALGSPGDFSGFSVALGLGKSF